MREAQLIVVGTGRSEGLAWEIQAAHESAVLQKTLIVFAPEAYSTAADRLQLTEADRQELNPSCTCSITELGGRLVGVSYDADVPFAPVR